MEFYRIPHSSDVLVEYDFILVDKHVGRVAKIIALVSILGFVVILIVVSEKCTVASDIMWSIGFITKNEVYNCSKNERC